MTDSAAGTRPDDHDLLDAPDAVARLRTRVAAQFPALREDLEALVRIPSVSNATFDQSVMDRSAQAVADLLRGAGMPDVRVLHATGPDGSRSRPAVVARRPAPQGAPTVLLYAHHDVQPPGDRAHWDSGPFEPVEREGRLYGRGAADDKAGIVAHVGALRVLGDELGVGVTVFSEGEEEIGSPQFGPFLAEHQDLLAADVIVAADSSNWKVGTPGLTTTLRGLVDCTVEVEVLRQAVHSGMFGGPVLDAYTILARLLATLHDADGEVAVPGLHHAPEPSVDYDERSFRADAGLPDGIRLAGSGSLAGRLWTKPAIAVVGIDATGVDAASNTIAPRSRAKVSMRIAPGQDPAEAFELLKEHLLAHAPFGARVTVHDGDLGKPFAAPEDSAAMQAARWAFEQSWGTAPVDIGIGGSIPFIADLLEVFPDAAILVTGVEDPDSLAHGANESVHLGDLEHVVLAEALLLRRLARG
ncbi:dipeptidase [Cellulomonas sp. PhB143]|uniref:dipeptidase n=1 Tax=Cellulomonas sp. PhB143 TaxID=2485186 RepID=UPI000F4A48F0|nr:dipeptidase [Cellulomonas sp. PhB143]ROS73032.1 acetylornithine deacetylase/succinyl-diaminopimelate desuccinylase-like protein [Cellulomonas sp. PhB143]